MPSDNSAGCATGANVSRIADPRVPAEQPVPIPTVHTAASYLTNLLHPSRRIAESDIPARPRNDAAMMQQFKIGEPEV